jgi:hypothetical protein
MAKPPKYPLLPLLDHRDRRVSDATVELAEAVRARENAETSETRARVVEGQAAARRDAVRHAESERLARGELRVADLARREAWEVFAKSEAAELADASARAGVATENAKEAEGRARSELSGKKVERDVVAKDRARWDERQKKQKENAEEEAAEEAFRGTVDRAARSKRSDR